MSTSRSFSSLLFIIVLCSSTVNSALLGAAQSFCNDDSGCPTFGRTRCLGLSLGICLTGGWSTTPFLANVSDEATLFADCECCWSEATRRNVITTDVPNAYMISIVRILARDVPTLNVSTEGAENIVIISKNKDFSMIFSFVIYLL